MLELLIYAGIAVLVIGQLLRTLGRTDGHNPTENPTRPESSSPTPPTKLKHKPQTRENPEPLPESNFEPMTETSIAETYKGEHDLKKHIADFDEKIFLHGARNAYKLIVKSFGARDKEELSTLVSSHVLDLWKSAFDDDAEDTEVEIISKSDIVRASVSYGQASVDVHFNTVIDNEGDKSDMDEIWTFTKNVRDADPNWLLSNVKN